MSNEVFKAVYGAALGLSEIGSEMSKATQKAILELAANFINKDASDIYNQGVTLEASNKNQPKIR